jgi:hypothetical protein
MGAESLGVASQTPVAEDVPSKNERRFMMMSGAPETAAAHGNDRPRTRRAPMSLAMGTYALRA